MAEPIRSYATEPLPEPKDRLAVAVGAGLIVAGVTELLRPVSPYIRGLYCIHDPNPRRRRVGRAALNASLIAAAVGFRHHMHHPRRSRR